MKLTKIQRAWGKPDFIKITKDEIQAIDCHQLPLQKGLAHSSYVSDSAFSITILKTYETNDTIIIKTGVFYTGIIAGCSCSDDPSPTDEQNEYCELVFNINKKTTEATVILLNE